jgi:F-box/leucine-rich repeat protein 2/20
MLSHSSPFIRTLDIHGLKNLQGSRLTAVLSSHVPFRFTSIDLRGCRKLGTGAINDLLTQCPEVRHLNLKGVLSVEPSTLQVIARSLHVLESLNLSRCFNISFGDLVHFLEAVEERGSSQITELRIAGLKGYGPTADSLLPRIATALPDLQVFDLQGSPHVFDASFKAFVTALGDNGTVCKIKHLNISSCPQLTDKALLHLAPHLANLEILELAGYGDRLQNAGLVAVIKQAAHLQRLDLDSATSITDPVTDALAARIQIDGEEYPSMLKTLILSFAKGLTAEGLIRLIKGCPALAELELDVSCQERHGRC